MYTAILSAISSISSIFSKLFEFKKAQIENQQITEIIHDKKDYKKASDIAEQIISLAQKYYKQMSLCDRLKFSKLSNKFYKVN